MTKKMTVVPSKTFLVPTPCGSLYTTINMTDEGGVLNIQNRYGSCGDCKFAFASALETVISASIEAGVSPHEIVAQLSGIGCYKGLGTTSCVDAMSESLREVLPPVGEPSVAAVRPTELTGVTPIVKTGCGPLYVTCNSTPDGQLFEVLAILGKEGACGRAFIGALGRLLSIALQHGVDVKKLSRDLSGISCPSANAALGAPSCIDAIGQILARF